MKGWEKRGGRTGLHLTIENSESLGLVLSDTIKPTMMSCSTLSSINNKQL